VTATSVSLAWLWIWKVSRRLGCLLIGGPWLCVPASPRVCPTFLQLSPGVSAAGFGRRTPDGRPFYFVQLVDQLERLQLERLQLDRDGCTVSW
jgi:hypothetical protein